MRSKLSALILIGVTLFAPALLSAEGQAKKEVFETPMEKLRRTFSGLRALTTAVESYAVDNNCYPAPPCAVDRTGLALCSAYDLGEVLGTIYGRGLTGVDAWGRPYLYWHAEDRKHYALLATGSDGELDDASTIQGLIDSCVQAKGFIKPQHVDCFEGDLMWCDGQAVLTPADELKMCR